MVVMICLLSFDRNWKIGKYVHYTYFEGIPRERKVPYIWPDGRNFGILCDCIMW